MKIYRYIHKIDWPIEGEFTAGGNWKHFDTYDKAVIAWLGEYNSDADPALYIEEIEVL